MARERRGMCAVPSCDRVVHTTKNEYCRTHLSERVNFAPVFREVQHGTFNEYANYGCRCEACVKAGADYNRRKLRGKCPLCGKPAWNIADRGGSGLCQNCARLKKRAAAKLIHGTTNGYGRVHRCRCSKCRAAAAAAKRDWRNRKMAEDREGFLARERDIQRRSRWRRRNPIDAIMQDVEEVLSKGEAQEKVLVPLDLAKLFREPTVLESPKKGNGEPLEVIPFESRGEGQNLIQVVHQLLEGGS